MSHVIHYKRWYVDRYDPQRDVACTIGSQNVNPSGQDILLSIIHLEGWMPCSSAIIALVRQIHHTIRKIYGWYPVSGGSIDPIVIHITHTIFFFFMDLNRVTVLTEKSINHYAIAALPRGHNWWDQDNHLSSPLPVRPVWVCWYIGHS